MKKLFLALLLSLSLVTPVMAAGKGQTYLNLNVNTGFTQFSQWIEQQDDWPQPEINAITNPNSHCTWSVNDHSDWLATGKLDAGQSTSRSRCIVSDFSPVFATRYGYTAWWSNAVYGFAGLKVLSPSPNILVSVCYQPQNRCFTLGSVYDPNERVWTYKFCGRAHYKNDDPALTEIVDSNGGRGVITTVTMTVTNPTGRTVRDLWAMGGFSSDIIYPTACDRTEFGFPIVPNSEYPFNWAVS